MRPLHLFEGYGIELEYMIVDNETLAVRPIADEVLKRVGGGYDLEVDRGDFAWSNELALHVIELKTNGPVASLAGVADGFQRELTALSSLLDELGARLLPTAMHPFMDPHRELRLWPHENDVIYQTFDRIFDCRGHGWANLQSMHINLPFTGDEELGKLHAAIRLVLPLLPAIAASSPICEGSMQENLDTRLEVYKHNAARVPSVSGLVVPEPAYSRESYERDILGRIYRDLEPHDPDAVLREEWVNARGAIVRFDRMAIEIRVLDIQEAPVADIAIATLVSAVVKALVEERWCSTETQKAFDTRALADVLTCTIRDADEATIEHPELLRCFGMPSDVSVTARALWRHLIAETIARDPTLAYAREALDVILEEGCLARRIRTALGMSRGPVPDARLREVYRRLAEHARTGTMFRAGA